MPAEPVPDLAGPSVEGAAVIFRVADPAHLLAGVRLRQEVRIPADRLEFRRAGDGWELAIDRPPVNRMEYLLELRYPGGGGQAVLDPGNPRQAPGAFGPKSVLEFPPYLPPRWLTAPAGPGRGEAFEVPARSLGAVPVRTWAPAGAADDEPLPLLVAHDGPEYDALASLTGYLSAGVAGGWLPRLRAALLGPGPRDQWYSGNGRYSRALATMVLPELASRMACGARIGMGASLGGLAMLHAHCRYPDAFDALFLQSGSFFCPRLDSRERWFPYYRRVVSFVADVHRGAALPERRVPVVLTCGALEENAANNRRLARTLRERGYPATLHEVPDMHNYTAWRDALDPHLTRLLRQVGR